MPSDKEDNDQGPLESSGLSAQRRSEDPTLRLVKRVGLVSLHLHHKTGRYYTTYWDQTTKKIVQHSLRTDDLNRANELADDLDRRFRRLCTEGVRSPATKPQPEEVKEALFGKAKRQRNNAPSTNEFVDVVAVLEHEGKRSRRIPLETNAVMGIPAPGDMLDLREPYIDLLVKERRFCFKRGKLWTVELICDVLE